MKGCPESPPPEIPTFLKVSPCAHSSLPQIRLSLACPSWPLLSKLQRSVASTERTWCLCFSPTLGTGPRPWPALQPRSLVGKGSQWLLRYAWQLQEIVENSLSRTSWLSVWKARFLRTLVLMDRTSSLKKAASLCCSE